MRLFSLIPCALLLWLTGGVLPAQAQVGKKLHQIEIRDMNDKPVKVPYFGEKHLFIFYVDPDHPSQNSDFTDYLEQHQIQSDKIHSFGVINLKDAPFLPNGVVRSMARKKMKQTGATIYSDPNHLLRDGWGLGDVNNKFCVIFVNKDGTLELLKKGELSQKDRDEVMATIEKFK